MSQLVVEKAVEFAKKNRRAIAKRLTDVNVYRPDKHPVSVFMAGSPGAGKTEASKELLSDLLAGTDRKVLRIDPDELREEFSEYDGSNAWVFQRAISILVEKIHDLALDQSQSFILDGTLSSFGIAEKNIRRSLGRKRKVQILYVYQRPDLAWKFVQARAAIDGRQVPSDQFVEQYFGARDTVNRLKRSFGSRVDVDLLLKNTDGSNRFYKSGIDQIDYHIPEQYDERQVKAMVL